MSSLKMCTFFTTTTPPHFPLPLQSLSANKVLTWITPTETIIALLKCYKPCITQIQLLFLEITTKTNNYAKYKEIKPYLYDMNSTANLHHLRWVIHRLVKTIVPVKNCDMFLASPPLSRSMVSIPSMPPSSVPSGLLLQWRSLLTSLLKHSFNPSQFQNKFWCKIYEGQLWNIIFLPSFYADRDGCEVGRG